jgi:hypothetical protein
MGTWSGTLTEIVFAANYIYGDTGDFDIGRVFISKNPDTPEIWTAFGKPLHTPRIDLT